MKPSATIIAKIGNDKPAIAVPMSEISLNAYNIPIKRPKTRAQSNESTPTDLKYKAEDMNYYCRGSK